MGHWIIDSLDSFKNVDSFSNKTLLCVARRRTKVLLWLWSKIFSSAKLSKNSQYFVKNLSHLILPCLKYYCIKSVSHCNRVDIRENILFFFLQYASILFCKLLCMCCLSHTHSGCARHKYIISCHLYWLKLEPISRKTMCLHTTVSVRVAVTSLPAPLAIKGSARNRYYMRLTGRSPIRTSHAKNRQIQITGRSIGAPLILSMQQLVTL